MAVDLLTEDVIPLADVTKLPCIPRRRGRGKLHPSTVWRWAKKGVGGIKLEVLRAGGTLCTSPQAVQRFFDLLAGAPPHSSKVLTKGKSESEVERRLDNMGVRLGMEPRVVNQGHKHPG